MCVYVPDCVLACQGTPCFAAPEVVAQGRLSPAADVYSYGVLLWLLLHGVPMRCGAGMRRDEALDLRLLHCAATAAGHTCS